MFDKKPTLSARQAIAEAYSIFSRSPGQNPNIGYRSSFWAEGTEATRVNAVETKGRKDPTDFIAWVIFFAAKVISCVEKQPEPFASWVKFAYSDTYTAHDRHCVVTGLYADFMASSGNKPRKERILKILISLAVDDYRYKVNTNNRKFTTAELISKTNDTLFNEILTIARKLTPDDSKAVKVSKDLIKCNHWRIDSKNWARDYLPHFVIMQEILDSYDRAGLVPVAEELKNLQKVFDTMTAI